MPARASQNVTLTWEPSSGPNIAGYDLLYGNSTGNYTQTINVGNTTTATLSNLTQGSTYFIVVIAYNTATLESLPSNEIAFTVAPAPTLTPTPTPTPSATATPTPPPIGAFVNGSFEDDYTGWTRSRRQKITTKASDGAKAAVFNSGRRTPNEVLSQTFATVSGQTYTVSFDEGVYSYPSTAQMRMQVIVQGNTTLLSQSVTVSGQGTGTWYAPKRFAFVADGTSATLTFQDRSLVTKHIDLLLDNVNVQAASH
jgi:hypothetical protein